MSEDFFQSMVDCLNRTAEKHRAATIPAAVWQEFSKGGAPSVAAPARRTPAMPRPAAVSATPPPRPPRPAAPPEPPALPQTQPKNASMQPVPSQYSCDWDELAQLAKACKNCKLAQFRHNVVFGEGNPQAELMFVGEGPGFDEDAQGRPFVGRAGQLLDKMISAMKYARSDVYIANIVKCRPPDNRVPQPDEAEACLPFLRRQIELVKPKVIVTLGKTPLVYLPGKNLPITRVRGSWMKYGDIPVMPTFHPAYLLRQESAKRDVWNDLKEVMRFLGKL